MIGRSAGGVAKTPEKTAPRRARVAARVLRAPDTRQVSHTPSRFPRRFQSLAVGLGLLAGATILRGQTEPINRQTPQFRTQIDVVNVTATVFDADGRFVPDLDRDDFHIYEDGKPQALTYFSADRVPVSLGIVLDTSGSMVGEKIEAARAALDRFLSGLLDTDDEVFLMRFSDYPQVLQEWTTDRGAISHALERLTTPRGGTALYDAIADALPLAKKGQHAKKALVLVSDGNDTLSLLGPRALRERIQKSDVLLYAVGIDGPVIEMPRQDGPPPIFRPPRGPMPSPFPPGNGRGWPGRFPGLQQQFGLQGGSKRGPTTFDASRVNVDALRQLTDETGGRTEIVRSARDLDPATTSIANELSRQYQLAYSPQAPADGRWHSIRVEAANGSATFRVRARTGYTANK
jgi:VWFA-related protein